MKFLPHPVPVADIILIGFHCIVDINALAIKAILLLAIMKNSPKSLRSYTVLLATGAINDCICAGTAILSMGKVIEAKQVLAYAYLGPCTYVSGYFYHMLFTIVLATYMQSIYLITTSFAYRYFGSVVVDGPNPSVCTVLLLTFCITIPNLIMVAANSVNLDDQAVVRKELVAVRPSLELDDYLVEGHTSILNPLVFVMIVGITLPAGLAMAGVFIIRSMVLSKLNAVSAKMSDRTMEMHRALTRILTLQAILPAFMGVPLSTAWMCTFDIVCHPIQVLFIMGTLDLFPIATPLVTLFCLPQYRTFVKRLFHIESKPLRVVSGVSQFTSGVSKPSKSVVTLPETSMMRLLLIALTVKVASSQFSDDTARTLMLPLAAAAYSDKPQECLTSRWQTAKLSKQFSVQCDYFTQDLCSGFTFFDESRGIIGMSFRGTTDPTQLIAEITDTVFDAKVPFQDGGMTSKYFNDAFMDVWNGGLGDDFTALATKYSGYSVWISGHSLGAALASMAAAHISSNAITSKDKIVLYTFGQPRTGDQQYADIHDSLVTAFRVTHSKDIVAHIPPQFMKYEHHTSEVWYDNDMAVGAPFVVCGQQEDTACSDKNVFNTSPDDHTHYYGHEVNPWGVEGCP